MVIYSRPVVTKTASSFVRRTSFIATDCSPVCCAGRTTSRHRHLAGAARQGVSVGRAGRRRRHRVHEHLQDRSLSGGAGPGDRPIALGRRTSSGQQRRRSAYPLRIHASGGWRIVYAGYVLDRIEGDTHFDTVYGMRAFDASSGDCSGTSHQHSRAGNSPIASAPYGASSSAVFRRHQYSLAELLYYSTNAGTIAALNPAPAGLNG